MKKTSEIQKLNESTLSKLDITEVAVRIVGATLNEDSKTLLKLLKQHEKNDEISFCVLSGLFKLLSGENDFFDKALSNKYDFESEKKISFKDLLSQLESILNKREYDNYSIALLPGSKISKEEFWQEIFALICAKLFKEAFRGYLDRHQSDDLFRLSNSIKTVIIIVWGYKLVDQDFTKRLRNEIAKVLDDAFIKSFSSSKSTVFNARRAVFEYWIKQLLVFNESLSNDDQNYFLRRWKAWFLLEDAYKIKGKKVDRKILKKEMNEIFQNLR